MAELPQALPPRCMHLCSKAMMVHGEAFADDADYQAGLSNFWCNLTARSLGPDLAEVGVHECSDRGRNCYQEY